MSIQRKCTLPALLAVAMAPQPVLAQEVGDRVRAFLAEGPVVGSVASARADGFELMLQGERRRFVPYRDVELLQWSTGGDTSADGFAWGMVWGFTAGLPASFVVKVDDDAGDNWFRVSIGASIVGGVLGWAVDLADNREAWTTEPLEDLVASLRRSRLSGATPSRFMVATGDTVRVSVLGVPTVGRITAIGENGFELQNGERSFFDYRLINRVEERVGTRHLWKEGMVYGAMLPLRVVAGCFAGTMGSPHADDNLGVILCMLGVPLAWVATVPGAVAGTAVGALIRRPVWAPVPVGDPGDRDDRGNRGPGDRRSPTASLVPLVAPGLGVDGRTSLELGFRIRF